MWLSSNSTATWSFMILFTSPLSLKEVYPYQIKNTLRREHDLWSTRDALTVHYYRLMMEPMRLKSWISISLDVLKNAGFIETNCDLVSIVTLSQMWHCPFISFQNWITFLITLGTLVWVVINPSWTRLTHPTKVLS